MQRVEAKFGMRSRLAVALLLASFAAGAPARAQPAVMEGFDTTVRPFLQEHCVACHASDSPEAGLDLSTFSVTSPELATFDRLRAVRRRILSGEMPPPMDEAPPAEAVQAVARWIEAAADRADRSLPRDPGRVTVRRLSRFEYRRTLRDLFGIEEDVTRACPADDLGYGFDNVGEALSLSTLHLEKYAAAAARVAELAILSEDVANPPARRLQFEDGEISRGARANGDAVVLFAPSNVRHRINLPREGLYRVRLHGWGQQAGEDPTRVAVSVEGKAVLELAIPETTKAPRVHEREVRLPGGRLALAATFVNDYYQPKHPDPRQRDRNLILDWIEIVGPLDAQPLPPSHRWIFAGDRPRRGPRARARPLLSRLVTRAFRRPATSAEIERLSRLVADEVAAGGRFEDGMRVALQAVLISPHFLLRLEPGARRGKRGGIRPVAPWPLATRLSYFLWSSAPDEALRAVASDGSLTEPDVLAAQVRRMLKDPRARALGENFAAQWLELRNLEVAAPDPERFPALTPALRRDLRRESEELFHHVLAEGSGVHTLLDADFSFMNGRLAAHYGLEGITGEEFRRVDLPGGRGGGLLTHAGVLLVTSNPTRTSPVKRGKWILENLLDAPPPPPPPGADSFEEGKIIDSSATLREQMERHRENPDCAVCHTRMDALGLSLENYDAVGRWRVTDEGGPIVAASELPSGRLLEGPEALGRLVGQGHDFVRCLAKKLFVYAVGRPPAPRDELMLDALVQRLPSDPDLETLILAIVKSDAFRMRRVDP